MPLSRPQVFFDKLRQGLLGPTLTSSEVQGVEAILEAMEGAPLADAAYALATAYLETAHTMQPIKEFGGPDYFRRRYDPQGNRPDIAAILGNTAPGDGARFCGRGYPMLTGRKNYLKASTALGLGAQLVDYPDLAMAPDLAAKIMRRGMDEGWFTGKKFRSYLPASGPADFAEFLQARRIINGQDRAADIANYALDFQTTLQLGGWG